MGEEKKKLYELLTELRELIDMNEKPDGGYGFDYTRVRVALEFAKTEIVRSAHEDD